MNIRPASRSDRSQIAIIHIESWKDAYRGDLPADFLEGEIDLALRKYWDDIEILQDDVVLVAEVTSIVGFISIWCRPEPFIDGLHVKASHRSKNIGTALMQAAAERLIRKGHTTAYLWVFESNTRAIRLYERLGGVQKEQGQKNIFGNDVLCRKIEWNDFSVLSDGHKLK